MSNFCSRNKGVVLASSLFAVIIFFKSDPALASCVNGDNLNNAGASCNFDSSTLTLCDWDIPEGNNLTWKADYNDVDLSPCISTNTVHLQINQLVRLRSPLLCPTNSTYFTYTLRFFYSMYHSDRCRFAVRILSETGDRLTEVWNTQLTTFDPRSRGWKSVALDIRSDQQVFYIVFAAERISSTDTVVLSLDSVTFTSQPVTTTTTTTTTTPTTTTTTTPTTTTQPPTTTTTTTTVPTTTTTVPTTTTTTPTTTTTTTPTTTTTRQTTPEKTTRPAKAGPALGQEDNTIIWGLTLDYLIAIGVGVIVVIIIIIAIAVACRRKKRPDEEVQSVSFHLQSPTAYDVNTKSKKKGHRGKPTLTPSKQKVWEPDMSLY